MGVYDDKLRDFLTHLQLERGASPHTVEAYRRDLIDLGDFVEHSDPDTIPVSVLDDYAVALRDRGLSAATVRRRMAAVRAFFKHRAREGGRTGRRTHGAAAAARATACPTRLRKAEAEAIVTRPDTTPRGLRDRAMLELLYGAGLRVSELVSLRVSDVDLDEGVVRVHRQGREAAGGADGEGRDRGRPGYLAARPPLPGPAPARRHPLPEPPRPGNHPPGRVPARARARAQRRESPRTSHRTRCGTRSRRTCSRAAATCAASRRCSATPAIETTQVYTHVSADHVREAYFKAHPRA